jgi:hypothetical protein
LISTRTRVVVSFKKTTIFNTFGFLKPAPVLGLPRDR